MFIRLLTLQTVSDLIIDGAEIINRTPFKARVSPQSVHRIVSAQEREAESSRVAHLDALANTTQI